MAKLELTKNQKSAVEDNSGTLLVSAAAGSGKTAILTQRLITRLCSENFEGDISEYLIVTFTKAATQELSTRLYKGLTDYITEHPECSRAKRQLSLFGLANISTIHSFCLDIIKQNFEVLSLPSKLRMGEETEVDVLLRQALEDLFIEKYNSQEKNEMFFYALEILSNSKSDKKFIESIIDLYGKYHSSSDAYKKFEDLLSMYKEVEECNEIFSTKFGRIIKDDIDFEISRTIVELECLCEEISYDEILSDAIIPAIKADIDKLTYIHSELQNGYEKLSAATSLFGTTRAKTIKVYDMPEYLDQIKKARSKCNEKINAVFSRYLSATSQLFKACANETRLVLTEILSILDELDKRFSALKLQRGILDFSDLEQYALKLLVSDTGEFGGNFERTALAENISRNFREIYIDEYQDTNALQDMIFRAVARYDKDTGEECNRFLVGDLKQSIYRFRGAQPEIFASYINEFTSVNDDVDNKTKRHKVYLSNNFRCSEDVIRSVNKVFSCIMSSYLEDDKLIYSKKETKKIPAKTEIVLINTENDDSEDNNSQNYSEEALYIASKIKEITYNPTHLREDGEMYTYSDIAILSRNANGAYERYKQAFKKLGIPLASDTPEDFFSLPEIMLVMCLLNCIDNPQRDIYTAGLMYSPIFAFSASELAIIRNTDRKVSFYSCVEKFANENNGTDLSNKVTNFLETMKDFRMLSRGTPVNTLLNIVFSKTGILDLYSARNSNRRQNILRIYEYARTFEKTAFKGLSAFLEYLNELSQGSVNARSESFGNSVKFMSIHRSKGLEFPIVFLAETLHEFNDKDEKKAIIYSKNGVAIKLRDTLYSKLSVHKRNFTSINTPFREALAALECREMLEEEKRLLYVAMTRARNKLFITGSTKNLNRLLVNASLRRRGGFSVYGKYSKCFFDFLYFSLSDSEFNNLYENERDSKFKAKDTEDFLCYKLDFYKEFEYTSNQNANITNQQITCNESLVNEYIDILKQNEKFHKRQSPLSNVASKISVSQLKKGLLDEENAVSISQKIREKPSFLTEDNNVPASEKGTATHIFMQFASFESIEAHGIENEAERLLKSGFITKRMHEIIDYSSILKFLNCDLYKRMKESPRIYRERRFNLRLPALEFTEKTDSALKDEFILVQGVIDLYFDNGDGTFTLVDFKTDNVTEESGEEILISRHSEQMKYYKRAIEEITGKPVTDSFIYSFSLSREINVNI